MKYKIHELKRKGLILGRNNIINTLMKETWKIHLGKINIKPKMQKWMNKEVKAINSQKHWLHMKASIAK